MQHNKRGVGVGIIVGLLVFLLILSTHNSLSSEVPSISITNPQSYPTLYGNWTVLFHTTSASDLVIAPTNGTTWNDIEFLELKCGERVVPHAFDGTSVVASGWSCDEEASETVKVLTGGKHTLRFEFGEDVEYAFNHALHFNTSLITSLNASIEATSIEVVDTSTFYISYGNGSLRFANTSNGGTSWTVSDIDTIANTGASSSLDAVDSNTLFVSYFTFTGSDLRFANSSNGGKSWTTQNVDTTGVVGTYTSLHAVNATTIYIAYFDDTNDDLEFAKTVNGGNTWSLSTIDSAGSVGFHPSIDAPDVNRIYVSYSASSLVDLKFANSSNGGTSWSVATVADMSGGVEFRTSVDAVDNNTIYIAYRGFPSAILRVANSSNAATSWTLSTVDPTGTAASYSSLYASDASTIFISYSNDSGGDLKLANSSNAGTSWSLRVIDTADTIFFVKDTVGIFSSIAGIGTSNLYISYLNTTTHPSGLSSLKFAQFAAPSVPGSACGSLTTSATMTSNLSSASACFTLDADNIVLDCANFNISFASQALGVGINATGRNNVTVKNCNVYQKSNSVTDPVGIFFSDTRNSFILHSLANMTGNTEGHGIKLVSSVNNTLVNNTVLALTGQGIRLGSSHNNTIINNTLTSANGGIRLDLSTNNTFFNNTAIGLASTGGIEFTTSSNNIFTNNTFFSTSLSGVSISGGTNNTFTENTISTDSGAALLFTLTAQNNTFFNNIIHTNATWIKTDADSELNNFTNTLFEANNGSVLIINTATIPNATNVNQSNFNISFNRAFLNSSALSFLNQSAQITFRNNIFADPRPYVDFEDDGTSVQCTSPQCEKISFASGTFVYNVTSFTTYSSNDTNLSPSIAQAVLNSTFGGNFTTENITSYAISPSDPEGDTVRIITTWLRNGTSTALLNMPFEANRTAQLRTRERDYAQGNNATVANQATFNATEGYNGRGAYRFDGDEDRLELNRSITFSSLDQWSTSFYAKKDADNTFGMVMGDKDDNANFIQIDTNRVVFSNAVDENTLFTGFDPDTSWHFYALVATGTQMDLYVDGEFIERQEATTTLTIDSIGDGHFAAGFDFDGLIDDVTIWNLTLKPTQIRALYQNRTDIIASPMTRAGETWSAQLIPTDGFSDGDMSQTGSVTILEGDHWVFNAAVLNSTSRRNTTRENLTASFDYATRVDTFTTWYRNGNALMLLNIPSNNEEDPAHDYSPQNNTATITGNVAWKISEGYDGKGVFRFDGSNDRLEISTITLGSSSNWSVSFHAKKDADGQAGMVLGDKDDTNDFIQLDTSEVVFRNTAGTNVAFVGHNPDTSWHFYALTATGAAINLYVDGNFVNTQSIVTTFEIDSIGDGHTSSGLDFDGLIDEVVIWNRTLTSAQVNALFNNRTDLIASGEISAGDVWLACAVPNDQLSDGRNRCTNDMTILSQNAPAITRVILNSTTGSGAASNTSRTNENLTVVIFNATDADGDYVTNITDWREYDGGVAKSIAVLNMPFETNANSTAAGAIRDYSTFANNGTLGDGTAGSEPVWNLSGKIGGAYVFDGVNDIILSSATLNLGDVDKNTISMWFYPTNSADGTQMLFGWNPGSGQGLQVDWTANSGMNCWVGTGTWGQVSYSFSNVALNQWHHVACDYDGSFMRIYIDGVQTNSASKSGLIASGNTKLGIGNYVSTPTLFGFYGTIDEVQIYNRSLSSEQIYQLYLDGNRSKHLETIAPNETAIGDIWQVAVTPNDNQPSTDGVMVLSNNVTIVANTAPSIAQVILNSTNPRNNNTFQNLTVHVIDATDADGDYVTNITDWREYDNGVAKSIAVLNMPFETNASSTGTGAIRDYSTFANNGTLGNGTAGTEPVWNLSGKTRGAYVFDGVNDEMPIADQNSLDFAAAQSFSIEAWIRTGFSSDQQVIVNKFSTGVSAGYAIWISSLNRPYFIVQDGSTFSAVFSTTNVTNNSFHHVVGVRDVASDVLRIYVNGVLENTTTDTTTAGLANTENVIIGARSPNVGVASRLYFNGTIDEVAIYNRSLSAAQIRQLYLDGNRSKHPETIVADETEVGDIWQVAVTPNDNQPSTDGATVLSNNVTILGNAAPAIAQVILNSTDGSGASGNNASTSESLTVVIINATDADGDGVQNITDWRRNGTSIAVLNMPFETNTSSTAAGAIKDYSANRNNGTLGSGTAANVPTWTSSGKVGGAYSFDGVNDLINISDSDSLDITGAVTLEAWVKLDTLPAAYGAIVAKSNGIAGMRNYGVWIGLNGEIVNSYYNSSGSVVALASSAGVVSTNILYHIVTIQDTVTGTMKIFLNGTEIASGATSGPAVASIAPVTIGFSDPVFNYYLDGTIDEVRIYNRSLSAAQIRQLFLDGNRSKHPETIVADETEVGDIWQVAVTPNDNQPSTDGTTVLSNNVTIVAAAGVDTCRQIDTPGEYSLSQTVSSTRTCFNITTSNVTVDCLGFNVTYGTAAAGNGFNVSGATALINITVKNCNIVKGSSTEGSNFGIQFNTTSRSSLVNNTVSTTGAGTANYGIYLFGSLNNNLTNNTIMTNGTSDNAALVFASDSNNNLISSNTLLTTTDSSHGILIQGSAHNIFNVNSVNVTHGLGFDWRTEFSGGVAPSNNSVFNLTLIRNNITLSLESFNGTALKAVTPNEAVGLGSPPNYLNLSKYVNATNTSHGSWLFLNISYSDAEVSTANIPSESTLRLWKYNETSTAWVSRGFFGNGQYGVKTDSNQIFANISNFASTFGAFGAAADLVINATDDSINLGVLDVGNTTSSEDANDFFVVQNDGSVAFDLSTWGVASLFTSASGGANTLPNTFYQIHANSSESGTANTTYGPVPPNVTTRVLLVDALQADNSIDTARIGIRVTVPADEPEGIKNAQIILFVIAD